jgi:hypothetical protein
MLYWWSENKKGKDEIMRWLINVLLEMEKSVKYLKIIIDVYNKNIS